MSWYVQGDHVFDEIDAHPDEGVRRDFYRVVADLADDPLDRHGSVGILPLKGLQPDGTYSVPFDDALLAYLLMRDQAVVRLVDVVWL